MAYITYTEYKSFCGGDMDDVSFSRLEWEARKKLNYYTTGVDGYAKLKHAFPIDPDDAESVKRCMCKVVSILNQIEAAEQLADAVRGYTETENGLQRKVISRVESGNESISYMEGNGISSVIDAAVSDSFAREKLLRDTIREYLSGASDANGVNLLFLGRYPC
jgi:hypothetical protein